MPRVIALLNQKGGVGKTTLAVHLATAFARDGQRVLLVDADPQGSALDWSAAREQEPAFPVVGLPKASLHKELPNVGRGYDTILIDGPPRVYDVARSAIMASDLVVIPVQPSSYDVWAAKEIVDLLAEAAVYRPQLDSVFVVNRKIVNSAIGRDVTAALSAYPIPVLSNALCQRVAFAESGALGRTVFDLDPRCPASEEVMRVAKELCRLNALVEEMA